MDFTIFKPNKSKILTSVLFTFAYWYLQYAGAKDMCARVNCIPSMIPCSQAFFEIIPKCCGCPTFGNFVTDFLLTILVPFIVVYAVSSLMSLFIHKKGLSK